MRKAAIATARRAARHHPKAMLESHALRRPIFRMTGTLRLRLG